jgi:hypothetical protein
LNRQIPPFDSPISAGIPGFSPCNWFHEAKRRADPALKKKGIAPAVIAVTAG